MVRADVSIAPTSSDGFHNRYQIASVRSAFDLLFAFLPGVGPLGEFGVSELARRTGQTKNQTFRLLQTLMAAGIITQNPENRAYSLGVRLVELGSMAQSRSTLASVARPVLDAIPLADGEHVSIVQVSSAFSLILLDGRGCGPRSFDHATIGSRCVLHAGAASRLLLAYASDDYLDGYLQAARPLRRLTDHTRTAPDQLRSDCERIRQEGYSVACRDLDPDQCSVAVPIRDQDNTVIAAIGISSPAGHFDETARRHSLDRLLPTAAVIGSRLAG